MDDAARRAIEWDCAQVLTRFINALDADDYDAMAALMARDGTWVRPEGNAVGPSGVLDAMANRARGLTIRHVISNIVVDVIDDRHANGTAYLSVYRHEGTPPDRKPAPLTGVHMIGVSLNRLVREPGGWRIQEKRTTRTFVAE